jgi:hypothetical protein
MTDRRGPLAGVRVIGIDESDVATPRRDGVVG